MKYTLVILFVCAFVVASFAAAPNHNKEKRAANNGPAARKNEHHERAAPHPSTRTQVKEAAKSQAKSAPRAHNNDDMADLQNAFRSALDHFVPLARDGSSLALDAVKSFLGDSKARSSANLQKRAAKLATDSFTAVRDFTPTMVKLIETYTPKAIDAATGALNALGF